MKRSKLLIGALVTGLVAGTSINANKTYADHHEKKDGKEHTCNNGQCHHNKKDGDQAAVAPAAHGAARGRKKAPGTAAAAAKTAPAGEKAATPAEPLKAEETK